MIAWIDIETTGLDDRVEEILEVAVILTRDDLTEVCRAQWVLDAAHRVAFADCAPAVQQMHSSSGLWMASLLHGLPSTSVDEHLSKLLLEHCRGDKSKPVIAGSSVHFDKRFLAREMPLTHAMLHYRIIDVSSLFELSRALWPTVYADCPKEKTTSPVFGVRPQHRAMPDIEDSLALARYYAAALIPAPPKETT